MANSPSRPAGGGARMPPPPYSDPAAASAAAPQTAAAPAPAPAAPAPAAAAGAPQAVTVTGPVAVQAALAPAAIYEAVRWGRSGRPAEAPEQALADARMHDRQGSLKDDGKMARGVPWPAALQLQCASRAPPQAANLGAYKVSLPFWKTVLLGVLAGCYVALGAALLLTVGPNCMGIAAQNPGLAKYITGAIGEGGRCSGGGCNWDPPLPRQLQLG